MVGTVNEKLSFTDNFALKPSSAGITTASVTNFSLTGTTRNQTSTLRFRAATDMVYRRDPGGGSNFKGFNPNIRASYNLTGQTTSFSVGANYSDQPINFLTLPPDVVIPPGGTSTIDLVTSTSNRQRVGANAGFSHQVNSNNSINGSVRYGETTFDAGAGTLFDFRTTNVSLGWNHAFNSRLDGTVTAAYSIFDSDDPTRGQARTATVSASAKWAQTRNVTFNGTLGVDHTSQDTPTTTVDSTDFSGQLGINVLIPSGDVSATLGRSLSPGSGGALLQSTTFGLSGIYNVNRTSQVGMSVGYTKDEVLFGAGSSSSLLTISPSYSVNLTSTVSAKASYTLRTSDSGGSNGTSHAVTFNLTKKFNLLP
ncbi:MAG: hypothetical protein ACE5FS_03560 [Paracoccaceae bacterium]